MLFLRQLIEHLDCVCIPIVPVAKPRMTRSDAWKKRPAVEKYWDYKDFLRRSITNTDYYLTTTLVVHFGLPLSSSWSKKKRSLLADNAHFQKPDIDNLVKALLDSLITKDNHESKWFRDHIIINNDSEIDTIVAYKTWAETPFIKLYYQAPRR